MRERGARGVMLVVGVVALAAGAVLASASAAPASCLVAGADGQRLEGRLLRGQFTTFAGRQETAYVLRL